MKNFQFPPFWISNFIIRKNRHYFHSPSYNNHPRFESISISIYLSISHNYQFEQNITLVNFIAEWKIFNFHPFEATISIASNSDTLLDTCVGHLIGPRLRPATFSNHFPRIIPDNPGQIVTYLEQFRSPSLAKLLRWGDEYRFLTVSSIRW